MMRCFKFPGNATTLRTTHEALTPSRPRNASEQQAVSLSSVQTPVRQPVLITSDYEEQFLPE